MNLLQRLPETARQKLAEEKVLYPYAIKNIEKELEAESFWVNLRLETCMNLWSHVFPPMDNFDIHRFIKLFHQDAVHQA